MISKMTEPYFLCCYNQIPTGKDSLVLKWFQRWQNLTSFVGTFQIRTEKHSWVSKGFQRWQNLTFFVGTFKFQMKETVQYWNDFKDDRTLHPLFGHLKSKLTKTVWYWNNFKYGRTLHPLLGHWNSKRKRQLSIEMISKMTKPYILCEAVQVPTEKDSSVLKKWFQKWQNVTCFVGTFKFRLKEAVWYSNDFKDYKTSHLLFGHFKSKLIKTV